MDFFALLLPKTVWFTPLIDSPNVRWPLLIAVVDWIRLKNTWPAMRSQDGSRLLEYRSILVISTWQRLGDPECVHLLGRCQTILLGVVRWLKVSHYIYHI